MLLFTELLPKSDHGNAPIAAILVLSYEQRQKSRARLTLARGAFEGSSDIGIDLPRGLVLRDGDVLRSLSGETVLVTGAIEQLIEVRAASQTHLMRMAYHLGNRHVPVQIGADFLRLELDHVLENMVLGLGGKVSVVNAIFDPESGAYGGHSHADSDQDQELFTNNRHAPRIHDFTTDPLKARS